MIYLKRILFFNLLGFILFSCTPKSENSQDAETEAIKKPNIIFIFADDSVIIRLV